MAPPFGDNNNYDNNPNATMSAGFPGMAPDYGALASAIQRVQSPYVSFGASGPLQDRFPGVAHALDNIFLTAANIPQGRTVGENIAGVARGLIGGRQMALQHNLQQSLLPIELAQRQLGYQTALAGLQREQAQTDMYRAHAKYFGAMGDYRDWMQNDKPMYGTKDMIDDEGRPWRTNLRSGQMEYVGTDDLPQGYQPSFAKQNTRARQGALPGGLEGQILFGAMGVTDPSSMSPQDWQQMGVNYANLEAKKAGLRTSAQDVANQPKQTAQDFLSAQKDALNKMIGPEPTDKDYKSRVNETWAKSVDPNYKGDIMKDVAAIPSLDEMKSSYNQRASQQKQNFANYVASGQHRQGVPYNPNTVYPPKGRVPGVPIGQAQPAPIAAPGSLSGALDSTFGPSR